MKLILLLRGRSTGRQILALIEKVARKTATLPAGRGMFDKRRRPRLAISWVGYRKQFMARD